MLTNSPTGRISVRIPVTNACGHVISRAAITILLQREVKRRGLIIDYSRMLCCSRAVSMETCSLHEPHPMVPLCSKLCHLKNKTKGERRQGDKGTKGIKERKDEDAK